MKKGQDLGIQILTDGQKVTAGRIRAQLEDASKNRLREDLDQAEKVADWEARERLQESAQSAYKARLARIDDLANSFELIETGPTATTAFREMTRILREENVEAALAYVGRQREDLLSEAHALQASAQEQVRAKLLPLLSAAGLHEATGQAQLARADYQQLLTLDSGWPDLLHGFAWFLRDQSLQSQTQGNLSNALADAHQSVELAERLNAPAPTNAEWQRALAASLGRMADVLVERGQAGDGTVALANYTRSHELLESVLKVTPYSTQAARDVSVSLERLGDFLAKRDQPGDAMLALTNYTRSLEIREGLLKSTPDSPQAARDVSVGLIKLGDLLAKRGQAGDAAMALTNYTRSHELLERVLKVVPDSPRAVIDVALSHLKLAALAEKTDDSTTSEQHRRACQDLLRARTSAGVEFEPPFIAPVALQKIQHFVVLMLANRSFDQLFGNLEATNPRVAGLTGTEFNYEDPNLPVLSHAHTVHRADRFNLGFDPSHQFKDVQVQLYGPAGYPHDAPAQPFKPAPMSDFLVSALAGVPNHPEDAAEVMSCFQPDQLPVLSTLAQQFALFNRWHSSLPGPTWPNRFFIHAATSGGLTDSPSTGQIVAGFSFPNGTIYDRLIAAGKDWRTYHDGLPQCVGIDSLRQAYVDPFSKHFREMKFFAQDVQSGELPDYTFIEPNYGTGGNYVNSTSMLPLGDIRKGELLVKQIYEGLRNSTYWDKVMFIVTFDEHGGFYDHVPPGRAVPTGDDQRYANPKHPFGFDRLGVRVPALVISAYTQRGTIIGTARSDDPDVFDHTSVLATVEKRFSLVPLTHRDATARTLDVALNLLMPRLSPSEAPTVLPDPAGYSVPSVSKVARPISALTAGGLSKTPDSDLALALAVNLAAAISDRTEYEEVKARYVVILTADKATQSEYIKEAEKKKRKN